MSWWSPGRGLLFSSLSFVALASVIGACAKGETVSEDFADAGLIDNLDSGVTADAAPLIDAAPVTETLSQNTATNIVDQNSGLCIAPSGTAENSFYRKFDLGALGITSDFVTEKVTMGIESVDANGGTFPVTVKLHTLNGDFILANMTEIGSTLINVAEQTLSTVDVNIVATVPGSSVLVVEIFIPDRVSTDTSFVIGSNAAGQSAQAYIRAPSEGCDVLEPVTTAAINFPDAHYVITVTGTH